MYLMRMLAGLLLAALMTACGGGGGSPGTTPGGIGGPGSTPTSSTPTVALELRDAANQLVTTVSTSPAVYAKATLRTAQGAAAAGQVVNFSGDGTLIKFLPASGSALTDASGVATVQVLPASATAAGAGVITATATVGGLAAVPGTYAYQVPLVGTTSGEPTLSLGLRDVNNASTNIVDTATVTSARAVLLDATGQPVSGTVVTFSGDTNLIKFSPAGGTVLTNSSGVATIQVSPASAAAAGAGTVRASATVGGNPVLQTFDFQIAARASAGVPTITLGLRDQSNNSTNAVSASGVTTARATVLDATGAPVAGKLVTFSSGSSLIKMNPASGQVLTDASGIAAVQVTPASLSSAGAGTLNVAATVGGASLSSSFDYQLAAANLALQSLDLGTGAVPAYGNRAVSVVATVNGSPATSTPVQVTFAASCGSITPAVVTTDSSGRAATTYKADSATCAGSNVTVSASAVGAAPLSAVVPVAASLATNIQFVGAAPELIYLTGSVGATQSQVTFKVVDASGNPLQNQQVQLSLVNSAPGVSLNTVGNTQPVTLTSDAAGVVILAVFSGTVPTSVQVRAVLLANASVAATSNVLTVASGRPVQRATSVSLSKFSIEGFDVDGDTSKVTIFLADRQGNPVPDGTQVNFTTRYGLMIPATCVVAGGTSSCSVDIRSQGDRALPFKGRVAILAYVPGEEDFVDLNGNNVYEGGEPFTDLGNAYRDEYTSTVGGADGVANAAFDTGEFIVPRAGSSTCLAMGTPNNGGVNGRPGTCDGVWGTVDVRVQTMVQFATSAASMVPRDVTAGGFVVDIADLNGNSMPTGSTISAEKLSGSDDCTVKKTYPGIIPNTYAPTVASVMLDKCVSGDRIGVTLKTPRGVETVLSVAIP